MTRQVTVSSAGGSLTLGDASGVKAGVKVRGTGMPPVALQWFEGAGEGKSYQGGRTLSRVLDVPVKVYGADETEVSDRIRLLSRIFLVENAPVTFTLTAAEGEVWLLVLVRTGGGDWTWGEDTDGRTFIKTVFTVEAGAPYWERQNPESRVIATEGSGIPLLGPGQSLSQLRLSSTEGMGTVSMQNSGDVDAWPTWELVGPFTGFVLARDGLVLDWTGVVTAGQKILVDSRLGLVTDQDGINRYGGLAPAPKFWSIPPGSTDATVTLENPTSASKANVSWRPRRAVVF